MSAVKMLLRKLKFSTFLAPFFENLIKSRGVLFFRSTCLQVEWINRVSRNILSTDRDLMLSYGKKGVGL